MDQRDPPPPLVPAVQAALEMELYRFEEDIIVAAWNSIRAEDCSARCLLEIVDAMITLRNRSNGAISTTDSEERMRTFNSQWPHQETHPAERMAAAGFQYLGSLDQVICHCCNLTLCNWELYDNPWIEHARLAPNCSFLQRCKGEQFVKGVHDMLLRDSTGHKEDGYMQGSTARSGSGNGGRRRSPTSASDEEKSDEDESMPQKPAIPTVKIPSPNVMSSASNIGSAPEMAAITTVKFPAPNETSSPRSISSASGRGSSRDRHSSSSSTRCLITGSQRHHACIPVAESPSYRSSCLPVPWVLGYERPIYRSRFPIPDSGSPETRSFCAHCHIWPTEAEWRPCGHKIVCKLCFCCSVWRHSQNYPLICSECGNFVRGLYCPDLHALSRDCVDLGALSRCHCVLYNGTF